MRKQSKQPISKLQRTLWEECRRVARIMFANKDGTIDCYTCDAKNIQGSNCQLGHLWAKASLGAFLKYDLRVLRWQCMRCNIHLGGQGAIFYVRMLKEIGKKAMAQLEKDKQVLVKAYDYYLELLEKYKKI